MFFATIDTLTGSIVFAKLTTLLAQVTDCSHPTTPIVNSGALTIILREKITDFEGLSR